MVMMSSGPDVAKMKSTCINLSHATRASTINYLYIGYDAFMAGVASSCPPLFEVDSQGAVTKFPLKHAAIVGAFKKKGNAPADKACRGGCGFFRATDSNYCSRCRQSPMATEVVERLPGNAEC